MKKIDVFIKDPFKKPRHVAISASLENLQKTVGGYIEVVNVLKIDDSKRLVRADVRSVVVSPTKNLRTALTAEQRWMRM